jgi:uncharacterized peroxidase-related enzyme
MIACRLSNMAFRLKEIDPRHTPALAELENQAGPSHFFRTMAYRPVAMTAFARLYAGIMGTGTLDRRLKEMIYLAVSFVNECKYCRSHHEETAREAGITDREIEDIENETDQNFTPRERMALRYAREMTREAEADGDTQDALWKLFTEEQLVELTLIVSLANFTNRFSNGLGIPVEGKEVNMTAP